MAFRERLTVRNAGRTAAGPFDVGLGVGEVVLAPLTLAGLEPGANATVAFSGPPCVPGAPLVATADVAASVDERDERGNVLVTTCAAVAARRASA